jgi:hypothetical protein
MAKGAGGRLAEERSEGAEALRKGAMAQSLASFESWSLIAPLLWTGRVVGSAWSACLQCSLE